MSSLNITILFAGDYHIYGNYEKVKGKFDDFIKSAPQHDLFDDELAFIVRDSDFSVFNLEDPISEEKNGISKYGPHGVGSKECLIPIQKVGFNMATFATNHTYDMGDEGILTTISECRKSRIDVIGAGLTKNDARKIFYKFFNNIKVAFLNYSRVEFNEVTSSHGGANPLNTIDNVRDIIEAKRNADFVFVIVHEGLDVNPLPYPELVKQMRFYADMGADAILLHHSRVVSGYEVYNDTPIFYGLGNIIHLTRNVLEHEGLFIKFSISNLKNLTFEIIPVELDYNRIKVCLAKGKRADEIINKIDKLSKIISNSDELELEWKNFVSSKKEQYLSIVSGHPKVIYRISKKLGLLKIYYRFLIANKTKFYSKLNLLRCMAHYEVTKRSITNVIEEGLK